MKNKIFELIEKSNSILLLTHKDPDGDAIGSVLAFYHFLTSINKAVDMILSNIPKTFNFLPSINKVVDRTDKDYDLCIVLDCASEERIFQNENLLNRCRQIVVIDHHISNSKYGNINLVEGNISSCCQIVYYLLKEWNIPISMEIGKSIISGVLTDTNGFSNNNVDADTYRLAAELVDLGINVHDIYNKVILIRSIPQYQLMKIAMDRLEFFYDGKIAYTYILNDDFEKVEASVGDHEGIVNIGRNIDGVEVSILIRENNGWSISLRSAGNVDVCKIALTLGGAGHFMAAGAKIEGTLEEVKNKVIEEIKKVIL